LTVKDDKDRWLDLLMSCVIDLSLGGSFEHPVLTFVYDYPVSQAALARVAENEEGEWVAKRFEVFLCGMELANGFYELTDAQEQERRFVNENYLRAKNGKQHIPLDQNFLSALQSGLPDCAGVALGVDRLLMVLRGFSDISQVISFSG